MIIAALAIAGYVAYSLYLIYSESLRFVPDQYQVLIVYNKADRHRAPYDVDAYLSVLTEEGVPGASVDVLKLIKTPAKQIVKNIPAIILPDAMIQHMPEESVEWVKEYLDYGGHLAVVYDAGIKKGRNGNVYRDQALLSDVVGLNYITCNQDREKCYTTAKIKFSTAAYADYFEIPPGKLSDRFVLSGYFYGDLRYPVARIRNIVSTSPDTVFAQAVNAQTDPAITMKKYGRGNVLFASLPLGYLKAYSDDLPLRFFLRTFLFKIIRMPHLVNTYQGTGKLVINWHVDSNGEWKNIPAAIEKKYLDKEIRSSIHITAGDFRDRIGDGYGFDACGGGRKYAEQYLPYGTIGSQGGWAHNWFAEKMKKNRLWAYEIRRHIKKNRNCLGNIAGYHVLEYSAPLGVHPQPVTTQVLENLGFNSYSYRGDGGSAPNRTFADGKMISEKVIAFPVLPCGKFASFYEMKNAEIAEEDVQKWLKDLVDYVVEKRTARLFQSQINDIFNYPKAVHNFLQYAKRKQSAGDLQIVPMSDMANFFLRFIKTQYSFRHQENGLSIRLQNEDGLYGITLAIPRHVYRVDAMRNITQTEDKDYYYLTVQEDVKEKVIIVHGA